MNKLCRIFVLVGVLAGFAQPAEADVGEHCAFRHRAARKRRRREERLCRSRRLLRYL